MHLVLLALELLRSAHLRGAGHIVVDVVAAFMDDPVVRSIFSLLPHRALGAALGYVFEKMPFLLVIRYFFAAHVHARLLRDI